MTAPPLSIDGHAVRSLTLRAATVGAWVAACDMTEAPALSGMVTLRVAGAELRGTVTAQRSFGLGAGVEIVGGGGGWGRQLAARSYHNDAGVKAQLIAEDAAREAGETLGSFAAERERVGPDYVRRASISAATALEYAAGASTWWVDYAGLTHVGERAAAELTSADAELLHFDSVHGIATLAVTTLARLVPGAVLADSRLGARYTVRDIELSTRDGSPLRATAYCAAGTGDGRLPGLLRALVTRVSEARLTGVYRYRVVTVHFDKRVDAQAVRRSVGLPDLQYVPQWPGLPGAHPKLTEGAEVLIAFADADPAQPVILGYAGPGQTGHEPQTLALSTDELTLGAEAGLPVARQGDPVVVLLPPSQLVGTALISGVPTPITALMTPLTPQATGTITGGSGRVKAAT